MTKSRTSEAETSVAAPVGERRTSERDRVHRGAIRAHYSRRDYVLRRALALADLLGIVLALGVAFLFGPGRPVSELLLVLPTLPLWMLLLRTYNLYERDTVKVRHGPLDDVPQIFHALVIGGLGMWILYRVVPNDPLVLAEMLVFGASGLVLIPTLRVAARWAVARHFGPERVLFLGDAAVLGSLARKMRDHPEYGLDPVALLITQGDTAAGNGVPPVVGSIDTVDLAALVKAERIERVIVSTREVPNRDMLDVLQECRSEALKVSLIPDHFYAMGPSVVVDDVEGITILDLSQFVLSRSSRLLKRAMDVAGSSLGLLLAAPVLLVSAIAIKLDSRGPVFFRQERVGREGRRFRLFKLRTMVADAGKWEPELRSQSTDPHWLKLDHDPRVTRVGRALRYLSIDELPQLWNVLRGEMSLVGPRPMPELEDSQITGRERMRLDLAPGITGLWQVMGRANIPFDEMTKLDYTYVTNWSLWNDTKLLLRTLPIILTRRGAN